MKINNLKSYKRNSVGHNSPTKIITTKDVNNL